MPLLTIFAGPNGSGKSSLIRQVDFEGRRNLLEPDAIARRIDDGHPGEPIDYMLSPSVVSGPNRSLTRAMISFANSSLSKQALDSEKVRTGLKEIVLGPARLYEALREPRPTES